MSYFLKDLIERAVKTFAQTLLASLTIATTLSDVDWKTALSTSLLAAIISILTSIVSAKFGDKETASIIKKEQKKCKSKKQ